ncbi:MAG: tRNA-specific adenosine deaminase [Gammaproteobacteria bacterium]|nr:MAG: tRNA-specific adenosine deaminase [Gammaproteobacteria bacterium]
MCPGTLMPAEFPSPLVVTLPDWLSQVVAPGDVLSTDQERMALAIELSRQQLKHNTGGPFGAIVCQLDTGKVVGVGVNRVVPQHASIAHAEVLAWSGAQAFFNTFNLGDPAIAPLGLYSSAQPCIACWGGLFWTGITKLVCGATKGDVEKLAGFNEGPVPADWDQILRRAGVEVLTQVNRSAACEVLKAYGERGVIYNPG